MEADPIYLNYCGCKAVQYSNTGSIYNIMSLQQDNNACASVDNLGLCNYASVSS